MATGGGEDEDNLSEECFDFICTTCSNKKINKQAISYCTDCNKNLCNTCVQIHDEYVEGHRLVDVKDADPETVLTEKCDKHKDKVIELFCKDHDDVVCSMCAVEEHRQCQELKHIKDSIEDLDKDSKIQAVPGQLKSALQDVQKVIDILEGHLEKLSEHEYKILEDIEEYTKRIVDRIKQMKNNAKKEVTTKHQQLSSSAKEKIQVCSSLKDNISKNLANLKILKERRAHVFVLKKKGQTLTKNVEAVCRESADLMSGSRLLFSLDKRIEACLEEFKSLVAEKRKYNATLESSIDVKGKGDKHSCDIEGCCLLQDGSLLLVDERNKKLKRLEPSTSTITDHCEVKGVSFCGITPITPHEVAVGSYSSDLHIVSLGNKLACNSTLYLNHRCIRLTENRGELFIGDWDTLYVHELSGKLLKTICKKTSGEKMFGFITGIAVKSTGDMIYIADRGNGLVCVDREGRERFRCSEEDLGLSTAYGVCTDNEGHVFVCGFHSNNVVQVSADGHVLGDILSKTDGIENPRCLDFDPKKCILYVGGKTSKLLMFKFEQDKQDTFMS